MKHWYTRVTPFVILCAVAVFAMIYFLIAERNNPAEVRYMMVVLLLPVILGMVVVDVILRYDIKNKLWLIWVIELLLLLATIYYWIIIE